MWFSNARLFQFIEPARYDHQQLDTALDQLAFTPCGKHLDCSIGWESPIPIPGYPLVYAVNSCLLISLRVDKKVIPASLIKQQLAEQVALLEKQENRSPTRKERADIKQDIYQRLISQALCQSFSIQGYIDTLDNCLIINTSSANKAELFTTYLRKALGSLRIQLPAFQAPHLIMTEWMRHQKPPDHFSFADYCTLQDPHEEPGIIRCTRQNLGATEIQTCLEEGKLVTELSLIWEDQLQLALDHQGHLRKLKYLDIIKEQARERHPESLIEQWDVNTHLMTQTLRQAIRDLMKSLV